MTQVFVQGLQELFDEQQGYLNYFYEHLDVEAAEKVFQMCLECTGLIVLTGVGKSGIIAEKIALTLMSTGTRALYLPAMNFLHGDIGIVSENDLVVMLSKSGESDELLSLLPHIRRRKAPVIALVSKEMSRLGQSADLVLCLPVEKELCPFDLAPTTSAEVQLLFGDALAAALMRAKGFSRDQYALNHPLGAIGRKMTLRIADLMLKGEALPLCRKENRLVDCIVELSNKRCGCLLVTDSEQNLLGIFTDGDLRRALQAEGAAVLEKTMDQLMVRTPLFISADLLVVEALKIMQKDPKRLVMVLPVVENRRVVGILRMHDIVNAGV